jgi:uncharacterized Zn-binding protein involved in type VI secretion
MPAAGRAGVDPSTGHASFPPRPGAVEGSGDVIINGSPALRVGDHWPTHVDNSGHDDNPPSGLNTQAAGSATVFVNGQPLARIGDATSDGDALAGGSPDVICG